ncbi:AAA family ATPase [Nitrosococcus watsonii]|uniref:Peptidoglycan-binding lysin domain protein n=1 Tax=Nitrosococcus watsoni (strain C-113) TaxID=105559 RepID=D8KBE2_NITWC|nr:AAA family ATPase [Nitrosococcus watsonii]ADJ29589.1 Peptidoglycan-binding lysin domain protein [Nitrosococcus watsonii C-113]
MYYNFYGFSEAPFGNTADPEFLYLNPCYREAFAALLYGVHHRKGIISLIGEAGTGKTTLLKALLNRLDENTKRAFLFYPDLPFDELLMMALVDLELAEPEILVPRWKAINMLQAYAVHQLKAGGNVVLLVDEAQRLSRKSLENLRLLQNLETQKRKLIQVILSGQQELDTKLVQPALKQLAQRISVRRYLKALTEEETYAYIDHRCKLADCSAKKVFSPGALTLIWRYSQGVPRRINTVCDNALLIGYALQRKIIDKKIVAEAANDCQESIQLGNKAELGKDENLAPETFLGKRFYWLTAVTMGFAAASIAAWLSFQQVGGREVVKQASQQEATNTTVLTVPAKRQANDSKELQKRTLLKSQSNLPEIADEQLPKPSAEVFEQSLVEKDAKLYSPPRAVVNSQVTLPLLESVQEQKETASSEHASGSNPKEAEDSKWVIVEKADTLEKIIQREYGAVNWKLFAAVLQANPDIRNPDEIVVGQVIQLPLNVEETNKGVKTP